MKRALLVGIDYYENDPCLRGCANDAEALYPLLGRHENGDPNFECRLATARDAASSLTRDLLLAMVDDLVAAGRASLALLYFAGHGAFWQSSSARHSDPATRRSLVTQSAHGWQLVDRNGTVTKLDGQQSQHPGTTR
jgi:hypothetical protein